MEGRRQAPVRLSLIAVLFLAAVGYRVLTAGSADLANTSPLMAMGFGGGLLLGLRFCWVPVVLVVGSDLALGWFHGTGVGSYTIFTAAAFTVAALAGAGLPGRRRSRWSVLLVGTLLGSLVFYLAANTFAWAGSPEYPATLAGWWQSQTVGLPGYPPSLLFLRNAWIGDAAWCLLALPLFFWEPARAKRPEPAKVPVSAPSA